MPKIELIQGDCLEVMKSIPDGSVDMVLTDPPYGTTACKWDSIIPLEPMWERLNKLIKPNGAIVLFGSEPFSSALRMSNIKNYKYDWVWDKTRGHNFAQCNRQPMKSHEIISVFNKHEYYPQKTKGKPYVRDRRNDKSAKKGSKVTLDNSLAEITINNGDRYPLSIQTFKNEHSTKKQHPTQKPVALMEYLIKTYTNEGETVLDFTMGSGTTGVACVNTKRNFIGIELDPDYFKIAEARINAVENKPFSLFDA